MDLKRNSVPSYAALVTDYPTIGKRVHALRSQGMNAEELQVWAETLRMNIETLYYQAKEEVKLHLRVHTRRDPYYDIYRWLCNAYDAAGIERDPDDLEVVLDAHDLTRTVSELTLVTGDLRHIVAAAGIICKITAIHEVRSLADYAP